MTIYRIGDFNASPGRADDLHDFLLTILPVIRGSAGCQGVQMYRSQDDPGRFTLIETWDSVEAHQASVKNIPPDMLAAIRPLLGASPAGSYFTRVVE